MLLKAERMIEVLTTGSIAQSAGQEIIGPYFMVAVPETEDSRRRTKPSSSSQ